MKAQPSAPSDPAHAASHRMLQITEREISQIILDIHDGPVQYIFAALSQLILIRSQVSKAGDAASAAQVERVDQTIALLEHALNEIRTFLGTFRPPEFERRDLLAVLEGLIIQHEALTGHPVAVEVTTPLPAVALPAKIALYRILQEALANSVRHGQAQNHCVRLSSDGTLLTMEVIDDGVGFDPAALLADEQRIHIGLEGMRERATILGGTFELQSAPGCGTLVRVCVPCR